MSGPLVWAVLHLLLRLLPPQSFLDLDQALGTFLATSACFFAVQV